MAPKKTTRKKAAKKKLPRKPSAKSVKKAARASKAPKKVAAKKKVASKKKVAAKKKVAKKPVARKVVAKAAAKKVVVKKPAKKPAKKAAKRSAAKRTVAAVVRRRDHAGHIDPAYAEKLREQSGEVSAPDHAFIDGWRPKDHLAAELGQEVVGAMTTGEDESGRLEEEVEEEGGGPFVETDGSDEFADGIDESNPEGATREPFPTS